MTVSWSLTSLSAQIWPYHRQNVTGGELHMNNSY